MTIKKELTVEELLAVLALRMDRMERQNDEIIRTVKRAEPLPKPKVPTMPFGTPQAKSYKYMPVVHKQ